VDGEDPSSPYEVDSGGDESEIALRPTLAPGTYEVDSGGDESEMDLGGPSVDFRTQITQSGEDASGRPDVIIDLPGGEFVYDPEPDSDFHDS
jgi:hypothetical protein